MDSCPWNPVNAPAILHARRPMSRWLAKRSYRSIMGKIFIGLCTNESAVHSSNAILQGAATVVTSRNLIALIMFQEGPTTEEVLVGTPDCA